MARYETPAYRLVNRSSHGLSFESSVGSSTPGRIDVNSLETQQSRKKASKSPERPLSEDFPDIVAAVVARHVDGAEAFGRRTNEWKVSGKAVVAYKQLRRVELVFFVWLKSQQLCWMRSTL
jgi:hypothetical protein